ncbi:DUF1799 domain-containing protein [Pseudomonas alliivorans]|uniref:DUF1799 domain-containing protein n=1 Tax=Pseudomonas alliivorans TaxID=2810613 RepID=UPI001AE29CF3|nr:DUF1799 domain-containing protein [Pseudomonas alliivorans]MBP0943086.1 DUF1799 domain-containing protein [Pseudomonas alliivorans]MEE4881182.1 DUF1799 domain-containing protein [Pseudomonas alliivorans]MEE4932486.1 DUF1799 domain-containing protein [Pseudomonas alliivorans]MEE4937949.1 DUF1799 domain-containing protein [Pseudomonas alliivorans]MEE4943118.1 DUF1799 domain-containing protein [Pseudomonas alliivorans]
MTRTDIPDDDVEVWPDVWPAFQLFEALSTQWRVGMGGPVGLDYTAVPVVAGMLGIKRRQLGRLFGDLRSMELEALSVMADQSAESCRN